MGWISDPIICRKSSHHKNPGLSFLLLIGVSLVGEGLDLHIPKGYIYFAMAFSTFVEVLNMRIRKRKLEPVKLRNPRSA